MEDKRSIIRDVMVARINHDDEIKRGQPLILDLSFKIDGNIRDLFNPKVWEVAYDKNDKSFMMSIVVALKLERTKILSTKITRKTSIFWTRSPKIPYRIWVMIIRDYDPFYPNTIEEAKSLMFDVNKVMELNTNRFNPGNNTIYADISASWGRHYYTEPTEINIVSDFTVRIGP
ncbi:MAG: hypothetical protein WA364_06190 [Candidatus Nitrosopolaris sp.]